MIHCLDLKIIVPCNMAEMASSLEELEAIRTKYKNLQREWDNQQEHLGRLQGDMFKMRSQLKNQSSFCASLGAIMGSLMWKTSRMPNVVDVLLSTVSYKFKTNETYNKVCCETCFSFYNSFHTELWALIKNLIKFNSKVI